MAIFQLINFGDFWGFRGFFVYYGPKNGLKINFGPNEKKSKNFPNDTGKIGMNQVQWKNQQYNGFSLATKFFIDNEIFHWQSKR